jgi:hypothetical protein
MDAIVLVEKTVFQNRTTIVEAIGYAAGSDVPVASKTYSTVGTLTPAGSAFDCPLEVAALIRWSTNARSTKNHPIYAMTYMHAAVILGSISMKEQLDANQKTALTTYMNDWVTGFSDGTNTYVRSTPAGHTASGGIVEEYVTHRDFPHTPSL